VRLVVTGGGTGGHIYPAIAIARYILDHHPESVVIFIGSSSGPEAAAAEAAGIQFHAFDVAGVVGRRFISALSALVKFLRAAYLCRRMLKRFEVECVVGTGGYASAPACLAAITLGVPLVLHEMNYDPGFVTRFFCGRAAEVAVAYEGTGPLLSKRARVRVTGVPVRPEIETISRGCFEVAGQSARVAAAGEFGLDPKRKTILVFGGSQGARAINEALWASLPDIAERNDLQVLHLTGGKEFEKDARVEAERACGAASLIYRPFGYTERMDLAYAAADIALGRAGAGTIAELIAIGLPAVLVPFPHATGGHQEKNAACIAKTGAVLLVSEENGSASDAVAEALALLDDDVRLSSMKKRASALTRSNGAREIAAIIEKLT